MHAFKFEIGKQIQYSGFGLDWKVRSITRFYKCYVSKTFPLPQFIYVPQNHNRKCLSKTDQLLRKCSFSVLSNYFLNLSYCVLSSFII